MATAAELRAQARNIRQSAQYAQGQTYRDEMAEAQRLENQANWLDDGTAPEAEDHG